MSRPENEQQITITIELSRLREYGDQYLAALWHVAQLNPAPHGDHDAGDLAGKLQAEIARRWLARTEPLMYSHQQRDYYWEQLRRFASYKPGESGFYAGEWVPRPAPEE